MEKHIGLTKKPKEFDLLLDLKPNSSCDYHRVTMPLYDNEAVFSPQANILVFNRMFGGGIALLKRMKADGVKIIVDWDDFFELDPSHYLYETFRAHNFEEQAIAFLSYADVVTVTTELLAAKLRPYHRNIVVIRNALPFDKSQFTLSTDKSSGTPVVWAGGASHADDLQVVTWAMEDYSLLTLAGYENIDKVAKGTHKEMSAQEWLKIKNTFEGVNLVPAVADIKNYMQVYDTHRLAIAPLIDNEFNRCKSNLKILEAGAKGIPIICSKVLPYFNPIDEPFVDYASKTWEWEQELNRYIKNPSYCEDRGLALAEHVRLHYNLDDANELRRQVYESLK